MPARLGEPFRPIDTVCAPNVFVRDRARRVLLQRFHGLAPLIQAQSASAFRRAARHSTFH
ncbi:hypothetical protein [Burkholderia mallei]|uniref:hypothetical protein n=1 Tax=Burkholderia mallei TaxID=13373 RepID=UPI0004AF5B1A|nr:hypothetical protein [Burkholderia mallei]RPA36249.1 hypothetical protein EGT59_19245 [Burkholderia mallei]